MAWPFSGQSWRGPEGEDEMTEEDWARRGLDQARAMREGGEAFDSSPDEDGDPTGGYYNGDYPDSWHDELNQRLEGDERYQAETQQGIRSLLRADTARREGEDPD
ncbi:hypothetical protein ACQ4N7_23390 [Nodosilinea sp. AN01ver1]|uniref:hypothetical protein n=1 Tax=Nodosilinea sp. AN01ver1 TaxID=3423362 RepID=UPI003D30FAF4